MMTQFRAYRNQYGNLYIFARDVPHGCGFIVRCVCLRQAGVDF